MHSSIHSQKSPWPFHSKTNSSYLNLKSEIPMFYHFFIHTAFPDLLTPTASWAFLDSWESHAPVTLKYALSPCVHLRFSASMTLVMFYGQIPLSPLVLIFIPRLLLNLRPNLNIASTLFLFDTPHPVPTSQKGEIILPSSKHLIAFYTSHFLPCNLIIVMFHLP